MFRECRLSIFANSERALQLFQPPPGGSLSVRHDLPVYHDAGGLEKSWTGELHSYDNLPFLSISSKCDYHDGFNLYDFGDWTGKVGTLHYILHYTILSYSELSVKVHSSLQTSGIQYYHKRRQLSFQEADQLHPAHQPLFSHLQFTQVSRQVLTKHEQIRFMG